ncbi:Cas8a1 family CRISPR/Cas system-associated protein [Veillonella sp. CHU740]
MKYNKKVCFTCEKSNTYSYKTYGRTNILEVYS